MLGNTKKSGFTLIELLVVIAIISILAAILFPVFAQAREKARQTACLSNLKQMGLAFQQYSQDYDEQFPDGVNWYNPGGNGWAGQVYTYVKSTAVYQCPDDIQGSKVSYSYNSNNTNPTGATVSSYVISKYNSPSKTILLSEVQGNYSTTVWSVSGDPSTSGSDAYVGTGSNGYSPAGYGLWLNGDGTYSSPATLKYATGYVRNCSTEYFQPANYYYAAATGRHTGGANYLLADDHAKFFRPGAVSAGVTNSSETDCGNGTTNGSGYLQAAGTGCGDSTIAATYSLE